MRVFDACTHLLRIKWQSKKIYRKSQLQLCKIDSKTTTVKMCKFLRQNFVYFYHSEKWTHCFFRFKHLFALENGIFSFFYLFGLKFNFGSILLNQFRVKNFMQMPYIWRFRNSLFNSIFVHASNLNIKIILLIANTMFTTDKFAHKTEQIRNSFQYKYKLIEKKTQKHLHLNWSATGTNTVIWGENGNNNKKKSF